MRLDRILPLLGQLRGYRAAWLRADLLAGLSVAAVALPTAIAYPAIIGLPPETGWETAGQDDGAAALDHVLDLLGKELEGETPAAIGHRVVHGAS